MNSPTRSFNISTLTIIINQHTNVFTERFQSRFVAKRHEVGRVTGRWNANADPADKTYRGRVRTYITDGMG